MTQTASSSCVAVACGLANAWICPGAHTSVQAWSRVQGDQDARQSGAEHAGEESDGDEWMDSHNYAVDAPPSPSATQEEEEQDSAPPRSPFRSAPFARRLHDTSPVRSPSSAKPLSSASFMEDLSVDERRLLLDVIGN